MQESIDICNLTMVSKFNPSKQFKKNPKLSELYQHLFQKIPENLHNSMIDTLVCLRCFLKIFYDDDPVEEERHNFFMQQAIRDNIHIDPMVSV